MAKYLPEFLLQKEVKSDGALIFLYFCIFIGLAQGFSVYSKIIAVFCLLLSVVTFSYLLIYKSSYDIFEFLAFLCLTKINIPFNERRDFIIFLPLLILIVLIIKKYQTILKIKKIYLDFFFFSLISYFTFCLYIFFYNLQIPSFLGGSGGNSGILGRWNLLNTGIVLLAILISFNPIYFFEFIKKLTKFYIIVLIVSLLMLVLNIPNLPLFNSFTWSIIQESAVSRRIIIAGFAGIMLFIYYLSFTDSRNKYIIILSLVGIIISGGRAAILSLVLLFFSYWAIKKEVFGKSLLILGISIFAIVQVLLSPLILKVPEKYQRLVIIFPSEFYTGKLEKLGDTPAAGSSNFRFTMWSKAYNSMEITDFIGHGFGIPRGEYHFEAEGMAAFQKMDAEILIRDFMVSGGLHNSFVSIAYLLGIPALILFIIVFIRLLVLSYSLSLYYFNYNKPLFIYCTLLLFYFFFLSFSSDTYLMVEFILFLGIMFKTLYFYKYNSGLTPINQK